MSKTKTADVRLSMQITVKGVREERRVNGWMGRIRGLMRGGVRGVIAKH